MNIKYHLKQIADRITKIKNQIKLINTNKLIRASYFTIISSVTIAVINGFIYINRLNISFNLGLCDSIIVKAQWIWLIAFFYFIFIVLKKIKTNLSESFNFLVATLFLLICSYFSNLLIPDSIKINGNYSGIIYQYQTDNIPETRENAFPLKSGSLYKINDPQLENDLSELSKDYEYVTTQAFIFWQTGLASGFCPENINEFNKYDDSLINEIILFLSIGPIFLFEHIIIGLYYNIFIMILIQLAWFLINKKQIWFVVRKE